MIVDASVAIKWLMEEPDSRVATTLLARDDLAAPEILDTEIGHVLTRKMRQRVFGQDHALWLWSEFIDTPVVRKTNAIDDAFNLSLRLRAGFADCLYLGLAISSEDMMITADERFIRAVRAEPSLRGYVVSLAEL